MRKFLTIICFCIFFNNLSSAGTLYGMGDFEISKTVLNHIYDYLGTGTKNKKRGAKRAGPGTYFAVAESGEMSGAGYCPYSQCSDNPLKIKQHCEKQTLKKLGRKEKCKLMFKGNTLKWNGLKLRMSQNDDVESLITKAGITVIGSKSSNQKSVSTISKKRKGSRSFTMNWQGYNNSITGNLSFVEEEKRGNINITLPKRDGSCIGSYILSSSQGTWSIICDKINKSASGFLKWNTKDGSVTGSGQDTRGNVVSFTVSGV